MHQKVASRDLKALTLAALQRRITTADRIEGELQGAARRGTAPVRAAISAFSRGAWSVPESDLGDLVESDPSLPTVLRNPRLAAPDGALIGVPDLFFPDAGVAAQVHSQRHHSGYAEDGTDLWSLTVEKDGAFSEHAVIVIGVTPRSIDRRSEEILQRIRAVVLRHLGRSYGPVLIDGVVHGDGGADDV